MFAEIEKPALLPLPAERFPLFNHEGKRIVHRDGMSRWRRRTTRRRWSTWGTRCGCVGTGGWCAFSMGRMEQIAVHVQQEAGRFSTNAQHIVRKKTSMLEKGATWLLDKASYIARTARPGRRRCWPIGVSKGCAS